MPTTEALQPDEYEDDELPPDFLIFTSPDLDQDEKKAREAGAKIDSILVSLLNRFADLEDIERALREQCLKPVDVDDREGRTFPVIE